MSDKLGIHVKRLALRIAQGLESGVLKPSRGSRELARIGFGQLRGNRVVLHPEAQDMVQKWLRNAHGIDWKTSPDAWRDSSRTEAAQLSNDEKLGSRSVAVDFIQVKPVGNGPVTINGIPVALPPEAHIELPATAVESLDAQWLLVTENLETFHRLHQVDLKGLPNSPGLGVFRSQPARPRGLQWATEWANARGVPLAFFCDLDPAGLLMARHGDAALLPDVKAMDTLKGLPRLFFNQDGAMKALRALVGENSVLYPWRQLLETRRTGFTQEAMVAAGITFEWVSLND